MKNILLLCCLLFIFSSCKKKHEQYFINSIGILKILCPSIVNELKDVPVVKMELSYFSQNGIDTTQMRVTALADMPPTNDTDSFFVNGINVPYKKAHNGITLFSSDSNKPKGEYEKPNNFNITVGQKANVYFNSEELGSTTGALKISEPIKLKVNDSEISLDRLSLSKDLKITWNRDSLNKGLVYISLVEYRFPDFSSKSSVIEKIDTPIQIVKKVNDNGILYIKPSELQAFHVGVSYAITVRIMRGAYTILNTSKGKKALFSSVSESTLELNQVKF